MTPTVAKWVECDLCGGTEPTLSADDFARLHAAGWRRVVVPIVWVRGLVVASVGPDDTRTATIDACPACCIHLRAAFVLVQRICSRRALVNAAAPLSPVAPKPRSSAPLSAEPRSQRTDDPPALPALKRSR